MGTASKITAPGLIAEVTPTDAEHIYFNANTHSGMGKDHPTALWMEIRGITYGASAHLHKWKDGSWNIGKDDGAMEGTRLYHHLWMTRAKSHGSNDASDSARRKAAEIITALVRQWVDDNPALLTEANNQAVREKRERLREKLGDLKTQIEAAKAEIAQLDQQLR